MPYFYDDAGIPFRVAAPASGRADGMTKKIKILI